MAHYAYTASSHISNCRLIFSCWICDESYNNLHRIHTESISFWDITYSRACTVRHEIWRRLVSDCCGWRQKTIKIEVGHRHNLPQCLLPFPPIMVFNSKTPAKINHYDVIKWKHFPRYWPFVRGIHRSPVNSPHKGQWRGPLMLTLICVWINNWENNGDAGDLRRYRAHYDVTLM